MKRNLRFSGHFSCNIFRRYMYYVYCTHILQCTGVAHELNVWNQGNFIVQHSQTFSLYVLEKVLFRRFKARLCVIRVLSVILPVYVSFANISQYQSSDGVWLDLTDSLHFVQAMT